MINLQYYYVGYDVNTGLIHSCVTTTYVINMDGWVEIPTDGDYVGKYYNKIDGKFYYDAEFTEIFDPEA